MHLTVAHEVTNIGSDRAQLTYRQANAKRGLFTVADFIYDAEKDRYTCPAGKHLTKGTVRSDLIATSPPARPAHSSPAARPTSTSA